MGKKIAPWVLTALGLAIAAGFGAGIVDSVMASGRGEHNERKYERDYRRGGGDWEKQRYYRSDELETLSLTIEEAVSRLKNQGYDKIYEVERKGEIFEVKAETAEGKRVRLYMDSWTGELRQQPHLSPNSRP